MAAKRGVHARVHRCLGADKELTETNTAAMARLAAIDKCAQHGGNR